MTEKHFLPARWARWTGALYLTTVLAAPFSLFYVPSQTVVRGNAAATAEKMLTNESLYRSGLVVGTISVIVFLVVAVMLYRLFRPVDRHLARLMVIGVALQIPVDIVLNTFGITSLMILKGELLLEIPLDQRQSIAMLFLKLSAYGTQLLELLWGLWLLPLGTLIIRSTFLPRWLGYFLWLNGIAYVIMSLLFLIHAPWQSVVQPLMFPFFFGELALMLWLVIKGVNENAAAFFPPAPTSPVRQN